MNKEILKIFMYLYTQSELMLSVYLHDFSKVRWPESGWQVELESETQFYQTRRCAQSRYGSVYMLSVCQHQREEKRETNRTPHHAFVTHVR